MSQNQKQHFQHVLGCQTSQLTHRKPFATSLKVTYRPGTTKLYFVTPYLGTLKDKNFQILKIERKYIKYGVYRFSAS